MLRMANKDGLIRQLLFDLRRQVTESIAPGERIPSVRDFAAMYGVSPTTIHNALQSLREQGLIRSAARAGWFRAEAAVSLNGLRRSAAELRVGILSSRTRGEWDHGEIYRALLGEAHRRGVSIVEVPNRCMTRRPTPALERIQLSRIPWNTFDVALLVEAEDTLAPGAAILKQHKVLAMDQDATKMGIDSIAFDDNEVGAIAARHLYELGHRRFAVTDELNAPGFAWDPNWLARRVGYETVIAQYGGTIMPEWRMLVSRRGDLATQWKFIAPTLARWVAAPPKERPTAFFETTFNDHLMEELARSGLRVPHDISVVAAVWNAAEWYERQKPGMRITTVDMKLSNLASRAFDVAAELAAERAEPGSRPPRLVQVPALLVPGQSTAPPRV